MPTGFLVFRRLLEVVGRIELALAIFILASLLAVIGAQVFSRYVLSWPLIWVEELASYLLIWLGFTAAAFAHKQARHVRIEMLATIRSHTFRLGLYIFAELVAVAFAVVLLSYVSGPMAIEARATSIGLPIDIHKHWFFSVPLTIGITSILATSLHNLAVAVTRLPAGDIPEPILGAFGDHTDHEADGIENALKVGVE